MAEIQEIPKDAIYNQAFYLMLRLHELMKRIDLCNINPQEFNYEFNNYNYKIIFNDLNSVLFLISSKLTTKELQDAKNIKYCISQIIQELPIWVDISSSTFGGTINQKHLNQKNWGLLMEFLSKFRLELESLMETHKIGNPSQRDVSKSVIDF